MATKLLNPEESRRWQSKIKDSVDASPLPFARADDATSPFMLEVTNGQSSGGGKTLIIHIFKRADMHPKRAQEIAQHALHDVFGAAAAAQADLDYRDVKELKKRYGQDNMINEAHDSLTIIFRPGPIAYTRSRSWVRDQMAKALSHWYTKSLNW
jgi:hypothetical protein